MRGSLTWSGKIRKSDGLDDWWVFRHRSSNFSSQTRGSAAAGSPTCTMPPLSRFSHQLYASRLLRGVSPGSVLHPWYQGSTSSSPLLLVLPHLLNNGTSSDMSVSITTNNNALNMSKRDPGLYASFRPSGHSFHSLGLITVTLDGIMLSTGHEDMALASTSITRYVSGSVLYEYEKNMYIC